MKWTIIYISPSVLAVVMFPNASLKKVSCKFKTSRYTLRMIAKHPKKLLKSICIVSVTLIYAIPLIIVYIALINLYKEWYSSFPLSNILFITLSLSSDAFMYRIFTLSLASAQPMFSFDFRSIYWQILSRIKYHIEFH